MVMSLNLNHGSVNLVFRLLYCCRLAALFILRCLFLFFIDGLEWNLKKENIQSIKNMMRCRWSYASFKIMQFLNIYCSILQCVVFSKRQFRNPMILVTEDFIRSFDVDRCWTFSSHFECCPLQFSRLKKIIENMFKSLDDWIFIRFCKICFKLCLNILDILLRVIFCRCAIFINIYSWFLW